MGRRRIAHERATGIGPVRLAALSALLLLWSGQAFAQAGAYVNVFGGGTPVATPSRQTEADRTVVPEETTARRPPLPGAKPLLPGTAPVKRDTLSRQEQEARDYLLSPPAGTALRFTKVPNPRLGRRQGLSVVQKDASGTRLGGGYDYPSPEAVTYDPRDLLEARVNALSDPRIP